MQDNKNSSMPIGLAGKIAALTQQTAKRAANICKRRNVPQSVTDVYIADVTDMLHGQFNGLRATTEQMQILTDAVPQISWDRTENAALCFIAQYYKTIAETTGAPVLSNTFLHAVVYYELQQRKGIATPKHANWGDDDSEYNAYEEAQRLYYTYAILIIGELTDVSADELKTMQPNGCDYPEAQKARLIMSAIDSQHQRKNIEARAAERRAIRKATSGTPRSCDGHAQKEPETPAIFQSDRTITQYQNITYMLGNGLRTADVDADGRKSALRPLRQAIAEQQQRAELIAHDTYATEQQRKQAAELIATTTAVYQVIDGIQLLPQMYKPNSGSTRSTGYDLTPNQWAQLCTQQKKPNAEQIKAVLYATAWLRTQSMQVWERAEKVVTQRDSNGVIIRDENGKPVRKKVQRDICTDFMPLSADFRTEYEDCTLIERATRLHIEVNNIIQNGRSTEYVTDDSHGRKQRLYLKTPATHILTAGQFADFQSDEERIFRNAIISTIGKPAHMAEDTLLARVFDYGARQTQYDDAAKAAQQHAAEVAADSTATDAEKNDAAAAAKKAAEKAKYYITNHMGKDVDTLRSLFVRALEDGLIKYYSRDEAAHKTNTKKYGSGYVWKWERPTADDIKISRRQ